MPYAVPGRADDDLDPALVDRWNALIAQVYEDTFERLPSRFIKPDPAQVAGAANQTITWEADPAVPVTCIGRARAQRLCDGLPNARHRLHDEYAEYAIVPRIDATGRTRPKRVQITTELAEYWTLVAAADPNALATMAEDVLGRRPGFEELYGIADPRSLGEAQRGSLFASHCVGDSNQPPVGALNTRNALFMTNPINGLDDLVYIVMFGARPYAFQGTGPPAQRQADLDAIFSSPDSAGAILACRHADPAAALGAQSAVWEGRTVAFADPLGMYIHSLDSASLTVGDDPIPDEWVRFRRGVAGFLQRLEVGPPDDDPRFLDDITVSVGASREKLTGGFQLLALAEIGPTIVKGNPSEVTDSDIVEIAAASEIDCRSGKACQTVRQAAQAFELASPATAAGPLR